MSQPVGIFAKIKLSPESYKKYLRNKYAKMFAQCVFSCLHESRSDFYVFNYVKKESTLYSFIYFNHGNGPFLEQCNEFKALKGFEDFLDEDSEGYLIGTLDAVNLDQEDFHYLYQIKDRQFIQQDRLSPADYTLLLKETDKHFYSKMETDFASKFASSRIVDTSIVKRINKLQEQSRRDNLKHNLHQASLYAPLYFFDKYYYNGVCLYNADYALPLPEINIAEFKQMPYGAADDKYVLFSTCNGKLHILETDPTAFKRLSKIETHYYISSTAVYDKEGNEIADADPKTFKLTSKYLAVDKSAVYFVGQRIVKSELGDFTVIAEGYYALALLIGTKQIYCGKHQLDIDAGTFKIIRQIDEVIQLGGGSPVRFLCLLAKDKQGPFIIYSDIKDHYSEAPATTDLIQVIRDVQPDIFIQQKIAEITNKQQADKAHTKQLDNQYMPECNEQEPLVYHKQCNQWIAEYFTASYAKHRYNDYTFYQCINNYFYNAFQLYLASDKQEPRYLDDILALYEKIKETAWINPHLFHHTACVYAAKGEIDQAVTEVRNALIYGYSEIAQMFADEDLSSLHSNTRYQQLLAYYQENIKLHGVYITLELLENMYALSTAAEGILSQEQFEQLQRQIAARVKFYPLESFSTQGTTKELSEYYARFQFLQKHFLTALFSRDFNGWIPDKLYKDCRDQIILPPSVHLLKLENEFHSAHCVAQYCLDILIEVKPTIKYLTQSVNHMAEGEEKENMRQALNNNELLQILGVHF